MSYEDEVAADTPVAWYRANATSGEVEEDEGFTSPDRDGDIGGTVGATAVPTMSELGITGSPQYSYLYDGSNDHIAIDDTPTPAKMDLGGGAFTIELWSKYATGDPGEGIWVSEHYNGGSDPVRYEFGTMNASGVDTGKPNFGWYNGSSHALAQGATDLTPDVFHHLVGVYDGSELRVYLNAVEDGSNGSPGTRPVSGTWNFIYIGRRWDTAGTYNFWKGWIDEVAFYDHALGEDRILAHYLAGSVYRVEPALLSQAPTIYSPTFLQGQIVSPGLVAQTPTLYAPTVVPTAITAAGTLVWAGDRALTQLEASDFSSDETSAASQQG